MPDWEKIYNFIARREENNDNADILSEMRRLPREDLEAFRLALDLFDLMKEYNITQEEARNVYEFKEDLKINDWQEAWRLYNEGGVIRREQNIPENTSGYVINLNTLLHFLRFSPFGQTKILSVVLLFLPF